MVKKFKISNLTPINSEKISPPRLKESKVSYECELHSIVDIGNAEPGAGFVVIGTIVMFHIADDVYKDGRVDLKALNPIGRLAGNNYTRVFDNFKVIRKIKPD